MKSTKLALLLSIVLLFGNSSQSAEGSKFSSNQQNKDLRNLLKKDIEAGSLKTTAIPQCSTTNLRYFIPFSYPLETHKVTTEDGYILTLFRLQSKGSMLSGKPVVFLQHGLFNDANSWLMNGEKNGLGFILANAGFDVWMGNNRGTKYSRIHKTYTTSDPEFWDFSFDEFAEYDLPANLAYISLSTGTKKIRYIGHSQGTSQMFAALSDPKIRPKVAPYIAVYYALAPIVFLDKTLISSIQYLAYWRRLLADALISSGGRALLIGTCIWDQASINYWNGYCRLYPTECYSKVAYEDLNPAVDNWPRTGYHNQLGESGTSFNCLLHYAQMIRVQEKNPYSFPKFDYGSAAANMKKYGQATPPQYDLSLIREKVRLWVGSKDMLATLPEAKRILSVISQNTDASMVLLDQWGHETFHFAADNTAQYSRLVNELKAI